MHSSFLRQAVPALGRTAAVFGLGVSLTVAQSNWFVFPAPGPGIDFTNIQDAVDAASPGDRIFVFEGIYQYFVVDKPLEILAVMPGVELLSIGGPPRMVIENLAPGEVLTMHGLGPFGGPSQSIHVRNCAGTVMLERVVFAGLEIEACADVRVTDSVIEHVTAAANSRVLLERVDLTSPFGPGLSQLGITDSEVLVVDSAIAGLVIPAMGVSGVVMDGGHLVAVDSTIIAGSSFASAMAPTIDGTGSVTLSNTDILASPGFPPIAPGVAVSNREIATLDASAAVPGETVGVALHGAPSAFYVTFLGVPAPPVDIGFTDDLWIEILAPGPTGNLDTSGEAFFSVPVPFDLGLLGIAFGWQGVTLTQESCELTTPSTHVVGVFAPSS